MKSNKINLLKSKSALSLLIEYGQTTHYKWLFQPARLKALSALELDIILQLVDKETAYVNTHYTGFGIAILQDFEDKTMVVSILEAFLQEVLPQILQRLALKTPPPGRVLFYWFAMWVHHQYPNVYKKDRLEKMATLAHIPFSEACREGAISMWSLRLQKTPTIFEPLATIEVNDQRQITQMSSKFNRYPPLEYIGMIRAWAANNQIIFKK